jgi:hypothetical protein
MWLIYRLTSLGLACRLACRVGWHNWWDAGEGELVCLDCGWSTGHQMRVGYGAERAAAATITRSRQPVEAMASNKPKPATPVS